MGSDERAADATARAGMTDRTGSETKEFAGKVAIVTGGGSGIGYGIARSLALAGARVAIAGRTRETLTRSAAAIEEMGGAPILPVEADVAKPSDCERMVQATVDRLGAVDILVNNAAYFAVLPLIDAEAAEAERFFAVNVAGPLNAARAFARSAIERGRSGAIVNVSSIAAGRAIPGLGLYSASKAALDSLTRTMALEWAGKGVRVNAVAPGHVKTAGVLADFGAGRLDEAAMIRRIPTGRIADFDDVAAAVMFLCSERARQIVGQVLAVDGGEGF
jgi:NAD(P)-dependent dehydrogenase (short-subunit alcohol dehydrogenase family)